MESRKMLVTHPTRPDDFGNKPTVLPDEGASTAAALPSPSSIPRDIVLPASNDIQVCLSKRTFELVVLSIFETRFERH
jgi:hypothetical protein